MYTTFINLLMRANNFTLEAISSSLDLTLYTDSVDRLVKSLHKHNCNPIIGRFLRYTYNTGTLTKFTQEISRRFNELQVTKSTTTIEVQGILDRSIPDLRTEIRQMIKDRYNLTGIPQYVLNSIERTLKRKLKKHQNLSVAITKSIEDQNLKTPTTLLLLMKPIQILGPAQDQFVSSYHISFLAGESIYFDGAKFSLNDNDPTKVLLFKHRSDYISIKELYPFTFNTQLRISRRELSEGEIYTVGITSITVQTLDTNHIKLIVKDSTTSSITAHLITGTTRIGRHVDNGIVIQNSTASKFHCIVQKSHTSWMIEDLNSRNGTFKYLSTTKTSDKLRNSHSVTLPLSTQLIYASIQYELTVNKSDL